MTLREAGQQAGGMLFSTVSTAIRRLERRATTDPALLALQTRLIQLGMTIPLTPSLQGLDNNPGEAYARIWVGERWNRMERWFENGVRRIHCLPWEASNGLRWAKLLADLRAAGRAMPIKDSLIAATALVHGLAVVTRNTRDFENSDVKVTNPFA